MPTPAFLVRLMHHAGLSRSAKLGPEDREAYAFANDLRVATLDGRLKAVWTHVPNELAGLIRKGRDGKPKIPVQIAIARALGLIKGTSDYLFHWDGGGCAMEFKSKTGRLTEGQSDYRQWCELHRVPFHTVRSAEQGLAILRIHGVLT